MDLLNSDDLCGNKVKTKGEGEEAAVNEFLREVKRKGLGLPTLLAHICNRKKKELILILFDRLAKLHCWQRIILQ